MYVVTGGAGFIGSNLVAELSDRGADVVVCDWLRSDERWRNLAKHDIVDLVAPEALTGWLDRHREDVEAIVHMGAISSTTETDVDLMVRDNVRFTLDLLQWCTGADRRLIYASSAATYGDGSAGFEDAPGCAPLSRLRPLNAYGWTKHFVDRRIARLAEQGMPLPPQWVGLKFFNVYGPNEYHKGSMRSLVAQNFAAVHRGDAVRLFRSRRADYADGGQARDFIYVKDCVGVISWLLRNPGVCGLFNVGTGVARSWLDLAQALFSAANRPARIEFIDMPPQLVEKYQYFTQASVARLRAAGYREAFTPLEQGIADYVQQYLARTDPYR
ncbi:MAG TPA: ADP-glyceromanno-heptose 6-epimerase [Steroidobacteraceae bacterium]|nr:ADP-glyceromanno-heptose 6-epimerase [Steroidobacteraceae bacterium]